MSRDAYHYRLGWQAAEAGEKRVWCEDYGERCLAGYDAYWDRYDPPCSPSEPQVDAAKPVTLEQTGRRLAALGHDITLARAYGEDCVSGYRAYWRENTDGRQGRANYRASGDELVGVHLISSAGDGLVVLDLRLGDAGAQAAVLGLTVQQARRLRETLNRIALGAQTPGLRPGTTRGDLDDIRHGR